MPTQLVLITGLADKDTIDATQDLTVTWQGDATASNTVLVLSPARRRGPFEGNPGQFVEPVFLNVEAAAGSYTIPAQRQPGQPASICRFRKNLAARGAGEFVNAAGY